MADRYGDVDRIIQGFSTIGQGIGGAAERMRPASAIEKEFGGYLQEQLRMGRTAKEAAIRAKIERQMGGGAMGALQQPLPVIPPHGGAPQQPLPGMQQPRGLSLSSPTEAPGMEEGRSFGLQQPPTNAPMGGLSDQPSQVPQSAPIQTRQDYLSTLEAAEAYGKMRPRGTPLEDALAQIAARGEQQRQTEEVKGREREEVEGTKARFREEAAGEERKFKVDQQAREFRHEKEMQQERLREAMRRVRAAHGSDNYIKELENLRKAMNDVRQKMLIARTGALGIAWRTQPELRKIESEWQAELKEYENTYNQLRQEAGMTPEGTPRSAGERGGTRTEESSSTTTVPLSPAAEEARRALRGR